MEFVTKIRRLLAKPFPREESVSETLTIIMLISLFVFVFLYVFKPFGIHLLESDQLLICLGFGAVTFVASFIYEFAIVRILKLKGEGADFTFGRWIVYFICAMLIISLANFLFIRIALFEDIQWSLFPAMIRGTFAIGFFPSIVLAGFALIRQERKYQNIADDLNQSEIRPTDDSQQTGDLSIFNIPTDRIRYIEAMQNYIKIGYVNTAGQLAEQTERATLKSVSRQSLGNSILRCHRSFLVNLEAVISTSGNAQGLLLSLLDCEKLIPVSRSYVSAFKGH